MLTLLRCIVQPGRAPSREGFLRSSENERKIPITRKIIMREKNSFLKNSSNKFAFHSQPLPIRRAADSEYLQEAKLERLLQPRLCVLPAKEHLMQAMEKRRMGMERGGLGMFPSHPSLCIPVLADLWVWGAGKTLGCFRCLPGEGRAAHSKVLPSSHRVFFQKGKPKVASW